jgi:cryptochrome
LPIILHLIAIATKNFIFSSFHTLPGFPWIDAGMRQLRAEGWVHHLTRHALACFLTRGDLWISWMDGARVFKGLLLDADYFLNNGNWLWLSCSCFFYQYFRCYSVRSATVAM